MIMKKILLIISSLVVFIALLTVGAAYYFYSQATHTPDWYKKPDKEVALAKQFTSSERLSTEARMLFFSKEQPVLEEKHVSAILLSTLKKQLGSNTEKIIQGIKTTISKKEVIVEAMVNLEELPIRGLPPKIRTALKQILKKLPAGLAKQLYVTLKGKPILKNGQFGLSTSSTISIGGIDIPLSQLMKGFGRYKPEGNFIPLVKSPFTSLQMEAASIKFKRD